MGQRKKAGTETAIRGIGRWQRAGAEKEGKGRGRKHEKRQKAGTKAESKVL